MDIPVAPEFARFLRRQRLFFLLPLLAIVGVVQWLFPKHFVLAGAGMLIADLIFLTISARAPLLYKFSDRGVYVTGKNVLYVFTGLGGVAPVLWIDLHRDPVGEVSLYHWRQNSALLVTTKRRLQGIILPMSREDAMRAQEYLLSQINQIKSSNEEVFQL